MKRCLYGPGVLVIGLLTAQIIGTLQVHQSILELLKTEARLTTIGYLAVPRVSPEIESGVWNAAIAGGVFFTLTTGAGLSVLTLAAITAWRRTVRNRRCLTVLYVVAWMALLYLVNRDGLNGFATLYVILVPLTTGTTAIQLARATVASTRTTPSIIAVAVLCAAWGILADKSIFTDIRDYLLLPHPAGRELVSAYYRFTLYPATASQPLCRKPIRTCMIDARITDPRIAGILRSHDYLPVLPNASVDLIIEPEKDNTAWVLKHLGRRVMTSSVQAFADHPEATLRMYSEKTDRNRMFRTLTLAGLVAGLPLTLFIFTFNGFRAVMDQMLTPGGSDAAAAICCAICGMALLAPVYQGHRAAERFTGPINAHTPELPIDGTDTRYTRIAALRRACEDGTDITVIAESRMHSADIAERYWLARSLACSHQPESRGLIRQLAADPSPIVACQALRAMGAQGNRTWIPYLVDRIQNDPHGYVQIYAYRALRTLGWVQPLPLTHDF